MSRPRNRPTGHRSPGNLTPGEAKRLTNGKPCQPRNQVSDELVEIGNLVHEWRAAGFSAADIDDEVERLRALANRPATAPNGD